MAAVLLLYGPGNKLLGYVPADKFPEGDPPESMVVGGRVFVYLEEEEPSPATANFLRSMSFAELPVVGIYSEIGAHNFDAIKAEGRGASTITWLEGCAPIGEPDKPAG
jgi:hypothetical protein